MPVVGVIPARLASTRLKGKVLLPIHGIPMIHHVYMRAHKCAKLDDLIVATDSDEVAKVCAKYDDKVVMTSADHQSGTDRVAEVARSLNADIIVNIQGDEPQLDPLMVDSLVDFMVENPEYQMGTVGSTALEPDDMDNPNVVKVIANGQLADGFYRQVPTKVDRRHVLRHVGLYAYRSDFLQEFSTLSPTVGEIKYNLEQLRAFERGIKIGLVQTDYVAVGVDTVEDLEFVSNNWIGEGAVIDE